MLLRLLSFVLLTTAVFADDSKAGLPGYCSVGGESIYTTIQFETEPGSGRFMERRVPNDQYREIRCHYSNGQDARVAVCVDHAQQVVTVDPVIVWESIKRGWARDMDVGGWSVERREKYWRFYEGVTVTSCEPLL